VTLKTGPWQLYIYLNWNYPRGYPWCIIFIGIIQRLVLPSPVAPLWWLLIKTVPLFIMLASDPGVVPSGMVAM